mmetsp:Transcript_22306/g.70453  ORF Transcript_22306/g.70453 Transcript_22306/m.70453 type:complete len:173 (+) Transcript_22306:197-715(+)
MRRQGATAAREKEAESDPHSPSDVLDSAGGSKLKNGDWKCKQCDNINWYWREACNRCTKLRPDAEAVARREAARAKREARRVMERAMRRPGSWVVRSLTSLDGRRIGSTAAVEVPAKPPPGMPREGASPRSSTAPWRSCASGPPVLASGWRRSRRRRRTPRRRWSRRWPPAA